MRQIESGRADDGQSSGAELGAAFGNRLIAALSDTARARIAGHVKVVSLDRKQFTNVYDAPMRTVDFPIDAVMSVVATLSTGSTCEVATIGREGFVEIDAALAARISHRTSFCQVAGRVARIPIEIFQGELDTSPEFRRLVMRAVRARAFMTEQLAMCNLKHALLQRFARWLLMTRDRLGCDEFKITHEFLGTMLGARRAGISQAAATLQTRGSIAYRRGTIVILNGDKLTASACECYTADREAIELCFRKDL